MTGFNIANRQGEEEHITHLLFANDTLVFCDDTREMWKEINRVMFDNINFSLDRIKQSLNEGEYPLVNLLMCIMWFFPKFLGGR